MSQPSFSSPPPDNAPQASLVIQEDFDYTSLSEKMAQQARDSALRIRQGVQRTVADLLSIGEELLAVKEALPHGRFGPWLSAEFGWTDRTARRFMNVAERFGPQRDLLCDCRIESAAASLLAAPSVPEEAFEEALECARNGECITGARAKEILEKQRVKSIRACSEPASLASERIFGQLLATLESFRRSWEPCEFSLLAREIREFADSLEQKSRVVGRSPDRASAG